MDPSRIQEILNNVESAVERGGAELRSTGFWKVVHQAKLDVEMRREFGARIADIDRRAFESWALVHVPLHVGTWFMLAATAIALGVVGAAYYAPDPWNGLLLLAGTGALLVTTHGLGHLVAGRAAGIRFTHWFIGSLSRPQPGVKIEYESYLSTAAAARARMHAAGAVVTKAVPFVMIGAAWGMEAAAWAWWALVLIGVVTIATDILWSKSSSDWKRYHRERRLADRGL